MKELIKRTKILWLFIIAISFVGCENDDDANLPELIASFAHTINEDTGAVSFLNLTENADSYTWDFGDGRTSTEINPIRSFPTGTYTVVLNAKNAAGASGAFEDQLVINIPLPINIPVTFDDPNVNYEVTTFNGASFSIVDNPDASGTNTSTSKVGAITNSGAAFEGIFFDLGMQLDLTTLKSVKANFWSDATVDVLLKLEEGTGADAEATASHGGTGWEEITFNFTSDANYSRFTLFVDGTGTTAGTFYIDDIEQIETPPATSGCTDTPIAATSLPLNFEGCATFPSADNFGAGITSELTENPSKTGINTSDFVLKVDKPTGSDFFAGIQNTFTSNFDLTTTNVFKIKVYSTKANAIFRFELALNPQSDPVTGNPAPVFVTIPTAEEWTEVEVIFTGLPGGPTAYNQLVIKPDNDMSDSAITAGGTYYFDDLTLNAPGTGAFDSGLLVNGDFENGASPWTIGVGADPVPIVTDAGNSFYSVDVTAAGNSFDVNMSQKLEIIQGSTYTLTFDAWSDVARSIVAGIGLSGGDFSNVNETVNITTDRQTYTVTLTATGFGAADARVLFDSGAEVGLVNIDNVSLSLATGGGDTEAPLITLNGDATLNLTVGDTFTDPGATASDNVDGDISSSIVVGGDTVDTNTVGDYTVTYNVSDVAGNVATQVTRTVTVAAATTFDSGLLVNGDFENGASPWTIGVGADPVPVVTDAGNSFYSVDVTAAGNSFDVNMSQKLEIIQGSTYTLTFDAWSDVARSIVAGIGLSGGDFSNVNENVNITTTRQTYTITLTAASFGAADARVLFDSGAEVGLVNIDNVSLFLATGGGDTEAPTITLNGDATVNLTVGDAFTDSGAMASDNVDGDISGNITVGGDAVDINTVGTYVITYNVSDAAGNAATQVTRTVIVSAVAAFDSGLLINGDFENGASPWTIGVGADPVPVVTDAGNSFYSIDVTAAGNSFDVNMSQKLEIIQGSTYTLTFDAWSDVARSIVAGIGLSGGDFSNVNENVNITTTRQTYTITLTAASFGAADARVLFDSGAEVGLVNIDNVSLVLDGGGGGTTCPAPPAGDLVSNGNFEAGEGCWQLIQNGGTVTLSTTESNGGGANSAQIQTGPGVNPAIKQERFAVGVYLPNTAYKVTFDIKASTPLAIGAVFKAFTFSEGADGSATPATQHILEGGLATVSNSWETKTYTFTSAANADQVAGGISFLAELVCGPAGCEGVINIDNVSITLN
jgi:hypothetical protein